MDNNEYGAEDMPMDVVVAILRGRNQLIAEETRVAAKRYLIRTFPPLRRRSGQMIPAFNIYESTALVPSDLIAYRNYVLSHTTWDHYIQVRTILITYCALQFDMTRDAIATIMIDIPLTAAFLTPPSRRRRRISQQSRSTPRDSDEDTIVRNLDVEDTYVAPTHTSVRRGIQLQQNPDGSVRMSTLSRSRTVRNFNTHREPTILEPGISNPETVDLTEESE